MLKTGNLGINLRDKLVGIHADSLNYRLLKLAKPWGCLRRGALLLDKNHLYVYTRAHQIF